MSASPSPTSPITRPGSLHRYGGATADRAAASHDTEVDQVVAGQRDVAIGRFKARVGRRTKRIRGRIARIERRAKPSEESF